jgi:hypothetical protein
MPSAASRPRWRPVGARFGPPFWLYPITALRKALGVLAVDVLRALGNLPHPHDAIDEAHGRASERTTGHAQIGEKPRRGPYFHRKAQIVPCDLISCLSQTRRPA